MWIHRHPASPSNEPNSLQSRRVRAQGSTTMRASFQGRVRPDRRNTQPAKKRDPCRQVSPSAPSARIRPPRSNAGAPRNEPRRVAARAAVVAPTGPISSRASSATTAGTTAGATVAVQTARVLIVMIVVRIVRVLIVMIVVRIGRVLIGMIVARTGRASIVTIAVPIVPALIVTIAVLRSRVSIWTTSRVPSARSGRSSTAPPPRRSR